MDAIDQGQVFDWGHTSAEYAQFRPGYPRSFFERIAALGIGRAGQRVLDMATGTGNIARELARRRCKVTGVDISEEQIAQARRLGADQGLDVDFRVAPAEQTGLAASSFEAVTAGQCWLYFDRDRAVAEVKRVLAPGGRLMTCHLAWLPKRDPIAQCTEELILKYNPQWTGANLTGHISPKPAWIREDFVVTGFFLYEEAIPFTRETWRGRIRACRAIGATLAEPQVRAFDAEHARLLERSAPESFTVLHWIDAHILAPTPSH